MTTSTNYDPTRGEYSTGRGGDATLPNGQPRPLTIEEQQLRARQALIRDVPIAQAPDPRQA